MIKMCNTIQEKENAYLTVYLALVFGIVLSLLLVLIEGAAIGALRAQAELVADLGLDSVFAEYNREILNQYELFFIDSSYGSVNGGIGIVEQHLSNYMEYNMNPEKELSILGEKTFLKLENPYIEIEEASFASDGNGIVWKAQAIAYMKAVHGGDLVSTIKEQIDTIQGNTLDTYDVEAEIMQQKKAFEEALSSNNIIEYSTESSEGYSYQKVSGLFDTVIGEGLLMFVIPKGKSVSGAVAGNVSYFSSRMKNGKVNQGTGLHNGAEKPEGIVEELIYGEYLMKVCGNYANPKDNALLQYQIEYILYGKDSDTANLKAFVERLFAVRAAADAISIAKDSTRKQEAEIIAATICTLLFAPELTDTLKTLILGIWTLAEAVSDVSQLLDGGKVPLIKDSSEWNTSFIELLSGKWSKSGKSTEGLSYQDYLKIFLGLMDKNEKVARSLDIVEMDVRQTAGNEDFRIDRCIDYMKVNFGFADASRHDFVFSKRKCYCQ